MYCEVVWVGVGDGRCDGDVGYFWVLLCCVLWSWVWLSWVCMVGVWRCCFIGGWFVLGWVFGGVGDDGGESGCGKKCFSLVLGGNYEGVECC